MPMTASRLRDGDRNNCVVPSTDALAVVFQEEMKQRREL